MEVKKLICDVCGGQIEMQSGGKGVCTSCGTPYSAEIIKDKIQEIRGTVKVDGPVETVKGDAEKERLLNMANDCLNKGNFEEAKRIYTTVSKEYSNDWRGWWGIICSTPLPESIFPTGVVTDSKQYFLDYEFKMALSFAPDNQKDMINQYKIKRLNSFDLIKNNNLIDSQIQELRIDTEHKQRLITKYQKEIDEYKNAIRSNNTGKMVAVAIYILLILILIFIPTVSNWLLLLVVPLGACVVLGCFLGDEIKSYKSRIKEDLMIINSYEYDINENLKKINSLIIEKENLN